LVEQLLSLARQEPRADVIRKRLRLDDLAREVVAEMVPLADARKIDLGISVSQPAYVLGDPDALRTLVRNLVDNAVRYTPVDGRVDLSVQESTDPGASDGGAVLRVVDTGPGIAPEERQRVFDRFYRPPGTNPPGSGLGMAIVKAISDAQGASIALGAGPNGQGLAVTVSFPLVVSRAPS
jgi:two-component system OmpR family sensor kinase